MDVKALDEGLCDDETFTANEQLTHEKTEEEEPVTLPKDEVDHDRVELLDDEDKMQNSKYVVAVTTPDRLRKTKSRSLSCPALTIHSGSTYRSLFGHVSGIPGVFWRVLEARCTFERRLFRGLLQANESCKAIAMCATG